MEWIKENRRISCDKKELDLDVIHSYLTRSYWCAGVSREIVERSIDNSLCFGLFEDHKQIGFARMISDYSTFGYLSDVFILEEHQGKGLGKWLMACIKEHPDLQNMRRLLLATRDAHGLYSQYGYKPLAKPEMFMEILTPIKAPKN
ncbi:MAG: GNAT family N-acetyltransferase [Gammaproteobacteria bacterium]|nr:GNAT family N-acetyltransferase [Gammaproteobacteria bacterium]MDH5694177.1 GNAT family N-acetyltransferase [Gammaproteobacteria bacterium]